MTAEVELTLERVKNLYVSFVCSTERAEPERRAVTDTEGTCAQSLPSKPALHSQIPLRLLHEPWPEQSPGQGFGVDTAVAQSLPVNEGAQVQTPAEQEPWPEQLDGQFRVSQLAPT